MKENKKSAFPIIPLILCILLCVGSATVFRACNAKEDGSWMHCHEAQTAVILSAVTLAVLFAAALFLSAPTFKKIFTAAGAIGAAAVFFIPGILIPMCLLQNMRCYTWMQPFVRIMSTGIFLAGLVQFCRLVRNE